ncbi:MAG: hypothetical protein R2723_03895 [Microbacterium sp.]
MITPAPVRLDSQVLALLREPRDRTAEHGEQHEPEAKIEPSSER